MQGPTYGNGICCRPGSQSEQFTCWAQLCDLWCKVTEKDDGNRVSRQFSSLSVSEYPILRRNTESLIGLGYRLLDLLGYFNDLVITRNFPRGPLAIRAIIMKSWNNMNMYVWDNLVCCNSIILAYIEAISLYC
jgi:hypothetical protein